MAFNGNHPIGISPDGLSRPQIVPAITSTGSAQAGQLVQLGANGTLDISLLPAGIGQYTQSAVASSALSAGQYVNLYAVGGVLNARPADSTSVATSADGFVLAAVASGATASIYLGGVNTALSGLTVGSPIFLSTVGGVTSTPASTPGNILQPLGKALSATSADFFPALPIVIA